MIYNNNDHTQFFCLFTLNDGITSNRKKYTIEMMILDHVSTA